MARLSAGGNSRRGDAPAQATATTAATRRETFESSRSFSTTDSGVGGAVAEDVTKPRPLRRVSSTAALADGVLPSGSSGSSRLLGTR